MPNQVSPSCTVYSIGPPSGVSSAGVALALPDPGVALAAPLGPGVAVTPGRWVGPLLPAGVTCGVGSGRMTEPSSPGTDGGRIRSQSASTLPASSAKSEARKTVLEGAAFTGSRHSAQRLSPWPGQ